MFATLIGLELSLLEGLSREQLLTVLVEQRESLSLRFSQDWLEGQSTDQLRLVLLAAKLLCLLRHSEKRAVMTARASAEERRRLEDTI
jgi:hypothetical protein